MPDIRSRFHTQLDALQHSVLEMGANARHLVEMAVAMLKDRDSGRASRVVSGDAVVDQAYFDVHRRWLEIAAEQQPMAGDLRRMTALLHVTTTLERMGDQAVNIAKIVEATADLPISAALLGDLVEMGELVVPMITTALDAFAAGDVDRARDLVRMDDPVDRLNEKVVADVMEASDERLGIEGSVRMILVARALERVGDQSVDIGEQVVFFVTGALEEFNDPRQQGEEG